MIETQRQQRGFALVAVMMLIAMIAALVGAHHLVTRADMATTRSSMDRTRGFYAAEAGLNLRAQQIREEFEGYNRPAGAPPAQLPGELPCVSGDMGSGDFGCQTFSFQSRDVLTFLTEDPSNPVAILIPPGEAYQNLNAQEYRYSVSSVAVNARDQAEALLEMRFKSRLVPLFQFAAFYNKDLEIYPGPPMTLNGPVHCNGDLYTGADEDLVITGQVTVSHDELGNGGRLFNGRKYDDCCSTSDVRIHDGSSPSSLPSGPDRYLVTQPEQVPWNGWIRSDMDPVTVPPPEALDPTPGQTYWDLADIRIMLDLDAGAVQVRQPDGTASAALSATLGGCFGGGGGFSTPAVAHSASMYNWREGAWMRMLEVDMRGLLNCLHNNPALIGGKLLNDTTEGGLVFYLGVDGPLPTGTPNNYGVRVRRGSSLASTVAGAPSIRGLTVVTNQAAYIWGDYNSAAGGWKPAAFLADSINVLSNVWNDANSNGPLEPNPPSQPGRVANPTKIYAAFLSGTDSTGGVEAEPLDGLGMPEYNGGLENYPRFHEKWTGQMLTYRGSFVSLYQPRHVDGSWWGQSYKAPVRNWGYETRFNDAANLPPLTPRFVYLTQELFVREFEY